MTTYSSNTVCQGRWEVYCDDTLLGVIDTTNNGQNGCTGSAMTNGCSINFPPVECANIELLAVNDGDATLGCCGGSSPDSMLTGVSAW